MNHFLLPKNQKVIDESAEEVFFTALDFFSKYCHIRTSEHCKEKAIFVCRYGTFQVE